MVFNISAEEYAQHFAQKYGEGRRVGWRPSRRRSFGYTTPTDHYEILATRLVADGMGWLDVGGGKSPFPHNPQLARQLADKVATLTVVDPSENVRGNPYAHEVMQCALEDLDAPHRYDVITMQMVVEHVADPGAFVCALSQLLRPGGRVLLITVPKWNVTSVIAAVTPFFLHHPIKKLFWGGSSEDTFPTVYRMNSERQLREHFRQCGFAVSEIQYIDDVSFFGMYKLLGACELLAWKFLRRFRLGYPEKCLIAVFEKCTVTASVD